jgi:hypothetical protein
MSIRVRWTKIAIENYRQTGERMKGRGYRVIYEFKDAKYGIVLTFWFVLDEAATVTYIVQQTQTKTGDVTLYRTIQESELKNLVSSQDSTPTQ